MSNIKKIKLIFFLTNLKSKPPLIAYTHNISNQDSENKSNFRTRRNSIILNLDKYVVFHSFLF